jgi:non-specific serine/threonine protein kinase
VHFDRWWNPAVENQATDRAYRIGQKRNVLVHKFVCRGTIEDRIDQLIESKRQLVEDFLGAGGEINLTEMGDRELLSLVALDLDAAMKEGAKS